jgi:spore germination protein
MTGHCRLSGLHGKFLTIKARFRLRQKVGANIRYNTVSQAPFFNYYTPKEKDTGLVYDARIIAARLKLVDEYDLAGVSYWTTNNFFAPNWVVLNSMFTVKKVI